MAAEDSAGRTPSITDMDRGLPLARRRGFGAHEAVAAARRGDAAGWDWLFDRYYVFICRYAIARLGDADGAEEIGQEVFVAAVGAIRHLRDVSQNGVEGWLLGIARNKITDRRRRGGREATIANAIEPVPDMTGAPDTAEVVVQRSAAVELRGAVERLPEKQRDVVVRRFLLDESLEQVAEATGTSVGAVKSLQHRALARLQRENPGGDQ